MQGADDMLREIVKMVDTSGDGKIQYEGPLVWFGPLCCAGPSSIANGRFPWLRV